MKMSIEINVRDDADPQDIGQMFAAIRRVEVPPVEYVTLRGFDLGQHAPPDLANPGGFPPPGMEQFTERTGSQQSAIQGASLAALPVSDPTKPLVPSGEAAAPQPELTPTGRVKRKRGQAADEAAASAAPGEMRPPGVPPAGFTPPPAGVAAAPPTAAPAEFAPPPGFGGGAVPPGMTPPAAPAAPAAPPPTAAVPQAAAVPAQAGGPMSLEDFKAECMELFAAAQTAGNPSAYPFNIIRLDAWPDGSPKPFKTMSVDMVPAESRRTVLDWCINLLSR